MQQRYLAISNQTEREYWSGSTRYLQYALNILFALIIFIPLLGVAQNQPPTINSKLNGQVLDSKTREPLPGASVQIKGTTHQVVTDGNGKFTFTTGQKFPYTLIITYIGYEKQELDATGENITINLKALTNELNEVMVVAYGTQEKRNLIGSVTKAKLDDVKALPGGSFESQLQGKVAGVQISTNTGVPGETINVRLRGATSIYGNNNPLYVIDGVFIENSSLQTYSTGGKATSPIADINPNDIESISVLKDAEATVLYGVRGANGAIIVTTKRGKFNQKPKVDLNVTQGWSKAAKLWELATGQQHAELVNENFINTGGDPAKVPFQPATAAFPNGRGNPQDQQTYDRLSQVFRTARLQNYDVSVSGGNNGSRYYFGAGYNKQESILRPIDFDRASFKANFDQKLSDKVTIGTSNTFARTFRNEGRAGDGPAGGILQAALHTPTYLSPYNEQGVLVGRAGFDNVQLLLDNYDVNSTSLRYIGNVYGEWDILPNLKFRSSFGADYNNYDESEYWNTFLLAGSPSGLATSSLGRRSSLLNEQTLTYRKKINDKHSFGVLIGNTLQSTVYSRTFAQGTGFANNSYKLISSAAVRIGTEDWSKRNLASFFAKVDYNFAGKYLFDASIRADGSSAFGDNKKWGYFPGVGAAWNVKEEDFLKDVSFLTDLKIRTSYGITGNQNGAGDFASLGLWASNSPYQGTPGTAPLQIANPDLHWERTSQFNVGLDAAFFNNRLAVEFNYYRKYTSDGIILTPLAATQGLPSYYTNGLEVSNKGFELAITSTNIKTKDFTWTTSLNVSRNINKIEKLDRPIRFGSRDLILQQEGSPLYSFWVYKELGVDPQTGNVIYEDYNGDGKITADDRQILGSIWPKFFGGFTTNLNYKSFDLGALLAFSYGNKVYNHNRFFGEAGGARDAARVIFASNVDRWQKPGDITDTPRPDGINNNNYKDGGGRWLENGSFLRLRSLTLGYTLPKALTEKAGIQNLRIYAIGANLFTVTKYTGLDPESSASSGQNEQGIDLGTPPQPRSFQLGVNVTF
ncbi:TonB-dependent receptor [Mucilaginibacter roseus]|uniref:TonB-dependent receptor n=1 Tax=Mucilaginibacter roseus TaxID=1528868 RepID=A0ABS8U4W3_9SPHI|nr:TonB-dependent receptor [Mucilaginibacter roseus]MCD8742151.1 TonB-dependent receptor [Mucilaginibacter roseus]